MLNKTALYATLVGVIISLGITGTLSATPDGSQNLRGLGGRTFAVEVTNLTTGEVFFNCYTFNEDGSWIDPRFPVPGTWTQNSNGAATSYSATAILPLGGNVAAVLEQHGTVTPAGGSGTLQIDATSSAAIVLINQDGSFSLLVPLGDFHSVGSQDDGCSA